MAVDRQMGLRIIQRTESLNIWLDQHIFIHQEIYNRKPSLWRQVVLFICLAVIFSFVGYLLPADGFIGFDWVIFFEGGQTPLYYPPWLDWVINPLSWETLIGLSLAAVTMSILKRARHPLSGAFAFLTLPLFWTIFLGQLEGLVVLGLLGLPWLAPLALIKPQISIFAFGARRSYVLAFVIVILFSITLWGPWPIRLLESLQYYQGSEYVQDIALGWWGIPLALPLLWFSRGDMDMLMVAGAFGTFHVIPYNLLPVIPAIARLDPLSALMAAVLTWLPLTSNWIGPGGWWLGWLFVGWLWLRLAANRYQLAFPGKRS